MKNVFHLVVLSCSLLACAFEPATETDLAAEGSYDEEVEGSNDEELGANAEALSASFTPAPEVDCWSEHGSVCCDYDIGTLCW